MSTSKSREHFLGINESKKMNCAQAIIAGFKDKFSIRDDALPTFASLGGGKAPEGRCGALHAAQFILGGSQTEEAKKCEEIFLQAAGSSKCKEIRAMNKLSCLGCVEKSAEILERIQF